MLIKTPSQGIINQKIKLKHLKLYKFKCFNDLEYDMLDHSEDLIRLVIARTDPNLIRYNKKKVFFMHPIFTRFGCDIKSDIYDLVQLNQPRIFPFQNEINITHSINNVEYPIKYKHSQFLKEALKLNKSDILKHKFEHEFEEAIGNETEKLHKYNEQIELEKKDNEHIHEILNHNYNTDTDDDNTDTNDTDDE